MVAVKIRNEIYKKTFISFFIAFIVLSFSFFIYLLLTGKLTFGSLEQPWDGVSVATQFESGNGTSENPYIIRSPEEFVYFQNLIEGDNYQSYQDKYYALDGDLNFGDKSFSSIGIITSEEDKIFKGHFDGRGHSIYNLKIDQDVVVDNVSYYSLFTKVENASIENLIMRSFKIKVNENEHEYNNIVGFIGEVLTNSKDENINEETVLSQFVNLSFIDFDIDYADIKSSDNYIGVFTKSVSSNSYLYNLSFIGRIRGNDNNNKIGIISDNIDGEVYKVISNISLENMNDINFSNEKIKNHYIVKDGKIYLDGEEISNEMLLSEFNDNSSDYYWDYEENQFVLKKYVAINLMISEGFYMF